MTSREFAIVAHGEQKYGDKPYIFHLDCIADVLERHGFAELKDAAYLHDTLEDTATTKQEIAEQFGERLAKIVEFCTDLPGFNRKTRKARTYAHMRETIDHGLENWLISAIRIKLADRIANIRNCLQTENDSLARMYKKEAEDFKAALYVKGVCELMWWEYSQLIMVC